MLSAKIVGKHDPHEEKARHDADDSGLDDFAIGAYGYNSYGGLVAVINGKSAANGGLPTSRVVPAAFGNGATRIDAEAAGGGFGLCVSGMGHFYGGTTTPVLVTTAPYFGTNMGRLYAFTSNGSSAIAATSAVNTFNAAAHEYYGFYNLNILGNVGPGGQNALGISVVDVFPPRVYLLSGAASLGPFNVRTSYTSSQSTPATYGRMVIGGGISGRDASFSYIGPKGGKADIAPRTIREVPLSSTSWMAIR